MSYEKRIEDLVGQHLAEFQRELSLAKQMGTQLRRGEKVPMPYGYPIAVYRPTHICRLPQVKRFIARTGGTLSNGVPRAISKQLVGEYVLGIYNPVRC